MATTVDQVATDALGLPTRSRAMLVEKLLASLAGEIDPTVESANLDAVRRRREDVKAGRANLVEGEEAMQRVRSALGR